MRKRAYRTNQGVEVMVSPGDPYRSLAAAMATAALRDLANGKLDVGSRLEAAVWLATDEASWIFGVLTGCEDPLLEVPRDLPAFRRLLNGKSKGILRGRIGAR